MAERATAALDPCVVVNLVAAVALIPCTPSLPFATYYLVEVNGIIRQISSAVWNKDGTIAVYYRDEHDQSFLVDMDPGAIVEVRQRLE